MNTRKAFRKVFLIYALIVASSMSVSAQQTIWSPTKGARHVETNRAVQRTSFPREFKLFGLNRPGLDQSLFSGIDRPVQPTFV